METIKIKVGEKVLNSVIYSYIEQEYDQAVNYYTGYTLVPFDSEVDESSPEYIKVTGTTVNSSDNSTTWVGYYKKIKYLTGSAFNLTLPMSNSYETNLYQEELINDMFVNDIKANVIPEMIDMEKVVFSPVYEANGNVYDVTELVFNFHFCERDVNDG